MDETNQPAGNPPQQAHRSQTFWQIYLPLIIAGLIAGGAFYVLLRSAQSASAASLRVWADIAATWIILLLFLLIFFLLAFSLLGTFGIFQVSRYAHRNLPRLNRTISRISGWIVAALGHLQKGAIEVEAYASLLSKKSKE